MRRLPICSTYVIQTQQGVNRSQKQSTARDSWGHGSDYHIQTSWVSKADTLKDSMIAYSKRMNEIRKLRGVHVSKSYHNPEIRPSLLVSTTRSSFDLLSVSEETERRLYANNSRLTRSLGSIKLEPLLGSQRLTKKTESGDVLALQVYKMKNKCEQAFEADQDTKVGDECAGTG